MISRLILEEVEDEIQFDKMLAALKKTGLKDSCLKSMRKELQQILLLQVSGLVLQTWKTAALHSFLFSVLLISSKRVLSLFDANFFKLSVVFSVGVSSSGLASTCFATP